MKNGNDKWEFYKDTQEQWRWRRTSPNGNIVGAATEGYTNKTDCEGNAHRNGWESDEMVEQNLEDEKDKLNKEANASHEDRVLLGGVTFTKVYKAERKKENTWRKKHHSMQRNMLTLIGILIVIIIGILLLTFFKTNSKIELSAQSLSDLRVVTLVLDPVDNEKVVVFGDTHFAFGKSALSEKAKMLLDKDVQTLKENPLTNVRMAGYTSAKGSEEYNQELSEERANSVRDYLIKKGIASDRITVIGYGRTRPALYEVKPGDVKSEEAKANMRVLFEVVVK